MFSCNVDGILNDLPGVAFIDKAADWKATPIGGFNMPPEHSARLGHSVGDPLLLRNRLAISFGSVGREDEEKRSVIHARVMFTPGMQAATTVEAFGTAIWGEIDLWALASELNNQTKVLTDGDLLCAEAMLIEQASSLNAMFNTLARKCAKSDYLDQMEVSGRLALKAQNQCRATLATLAEIKNPKRATFIKQQNHAVNQQINNGARAP